MIDGLRGCRGLVPAPSEILLSACEGAVALLPRAVVVVLALSVLSEDVLGCPACTNSNESGQAVIPLILGFMVVPFILFGAAFSFLRHQFRSEAREHSIPVAVSADRIVYESEASDGTPARSGQGKRTPAKGEFSTGGGRECRRP